MRTNEEDTTAQYEFHKDYAITLSGERYDIRAIIHHHKKRALALGEVNHKKWLVNPATNEKLTPEEANLAQQLCTRNFLADEIILNKEDGTVEIRSKFLGTRYERFATIQDVQLFAAAVNAMTEDDRFIQSFEENNPVHHFTVLRLELNDILRISALLRALNTYQDEQADIDDERYDSAESDECVPHNASSFFRHPRSPISAHPEYAFNPNHIDSDEECNNKLNSEPNSPRPRGGY